MTVSARELWCGKPVTMPGGRLGHVASSRVRPGPAGPSVPVFEAPQYAGHVADPVVVPLAALEPAVLRAGWEPPETMTRVRIEAAGTGGTSMGKFTRRKPVCTLRRDEDGGWVLRLLDGAVGGLVHKPGWEWNGYTVDEVYGEQRMVYHGPDFMGAVTAILGRPPYGYGWYRVQRDGAA